MASALDLGTAPLIPPPSPFAVPEEGIGLSDYARSVAAGTYGVGGALAGAVNYATRGAIPEWGELREQMKVGAEAQTAQMSPRAQRALSAKVLSGDGETIWDPEVSTSGALGLRFAQAIPSLVASMVPGAIVARAALAAGAGATAAGTAGTIAGGVSGGAQTGGDVFNQIMDDLVKEPDERLQTTSDTYRGLRAMGMPELEAKDLLVRQSAGYKPLIMAGITALTSRYGVESMVAHRAAGQAGRGLARGAGLGLVSEAAQEGIEG